MGVHHPDLCGLPAHRPGPSNAVVSPALEFRSEGFVTGTGAKFFTVAGSTGPASALCMARSSGCSSAFETRSPGQRLCCPGDVLLRGGGKQCGFGLLCCESPLQQI